MIDPQSWGTSVLLPVLWRQVDDEVIRLLTRAIASIEDQAWPGPHEIVLIDDGSPVAVERFRARIGSDALLANVRFLRSARNNGLVHGLNIGLAEARHPFIARMDADDAWWPGKIEKQFDLFRATPDLTITATGMHLVDGAGKITKTRIRPGDWTGILRFMVDSGCPFPHGSVLARRQIYRLLGGYSHDPATAHCEDYALWGTWLRFFRPAMVEEALYDYTISDGSISAVHEDQQRQATARVNTRFRALEPVEGIPQALGELAEATGLTMIQAGLLAHAAWAWRPTVWLPAEALAPLRALLPDRIVSSDLTEASTVVDIARLVGTPVVTRAATVCARIA